MTTYTGKFMVGSQTYTAGSRTGLNDAADPAGASAVSQYGHDDAPQPANWPNVQVTGRNLRVDRDVLSGVAGQFKSMADQLQSAVNTWSPVASQASTNDANGNSPAGNWRSAQSVAQAIAKTNDGVHKFMNDLHTAHADTVTRLQKNTANYEDAELSNAKVIKKASEAQSAWEVASGSGGEKPQHVDPFYGSKLTPAEQAVVAHLEEMNNADGPTWNTAMAYPVTSALTYDSASGTVGSAQLQQYLSTTRPDLLSAAGEAYGPLVDTLGSITSQLASAGQTLAGSWGGKTAVTAVNQIQQMHQTASDLQANAWSAQKSLSYYGTVLAKYQANVPQPAPAVGRSTHERAMQGQANQAAADHAANAAFQQLNQHVQNTFYGMPATLNQSLPKPLKTHNNNSNASLVGATGGGANPAVTVSGTLPVSSAGTGPGTSPVGTPPPGSGPSPVSMPSPGSAPAPVLSSTPPWTTSPTGPTTTTTTGMPSPNLPGGGPGPVSPVPVTTGLPGVSTTSGSGGDAAGDGTGAVPGDGDSVGELPGVSPLSSVNPATGGAGAGGDGLGDGGGDGTGLSSVPEGGSPSEVGGMPGMGGFGGGAGAAGGGGRPRQSWESEDGEVWDPADEAAFGAAPGVSDGMIGADGGGFPMMGGGAGGRRDGKDRQRQAWMQEDPDVWGEEAGRSVPPVLG